MAELGTIDYTNLESGAVRPSEGTELVRGIGQALDVLGQYHLDDVLGDFRGEGQQIITQEREDALTATVFESPSELEGEAGRIQRRARRLHNVAAKGDSSQRALAELELKRLLGNAQAEHPKLARHLQQEFGQLITSSSKLDEIGLIDSINKANAKQAEAEFRDMVDFARDPENGLGMNPSIDPMSAQFAQEFSMRSRMRDTINLNKLKVQYAASATDMDMRTKSQYYNEALQGFGNVVNGSVDQYRPTLLLYRAEIAKPDGQRNLAFMQNFAENIRPAIIEKLNFQKQQLRSALDQLVPTLEERATPFYTQMQTRTEDVLKQVDDLITAFSSEDTAAMDHQIASWRIRNATMRNQNPRYNAMLTAFDPATEGFGEFYKAIAPYDQTGYAVMLGQAIAEPSMKAIQSLIGNIPEGEVVPFIMEETFMRGGQGRISNAATPTQIRNVLRSNWGTQDGFYGDANSTEEEDIAKSLGHLELLRQNARTAVDTKSPFTAGQFLTTGTNALMVMDSLGNPSDQQIEMTEDIIADRNVFEASLLEGNGQNRNRRMAFAESAQDFYANTRVAERKQQWKRALEVPAIGGEPMINFIRVQGDSEVSATTQLTFTVDKERVRQSLVATFGGGIGPGQVEAHSNRIMFEVAPIIDSINKQVRAASHIEAMLSPNIDKTSADYINAAEKEGWLDYFSQGN